MSCYSFKLSYLPTIALIGMGVVSTAKGETWVDSKGGRSIEANFLGIREGKVLLQDLDGQSLTLPVDHLSDESRALAQRLQKTPSTSTSNEASQAADERAQEVMGLAPPPRDPVEALPPFPEDASLEETVVFVRSQLLAGHPEVFWYALPDEIRNKLNNEEFSKVLNSNLEQHSETTEQIYPLLIKFVKVLNTKKTFVLGSEMFSHAMQGAPSGAEKVIKDGYDHGAGLVYELLYAWQPISNRQSQTVTNEIADIHGPRVGAHLRSILQLAPLKRVVTYISKNTEIKLTDPTSGSVTLPVDTGKMKTVSMVHYAGRWLPESLVQEWTASKDTLYEDLSKQLGGPKSSGPDSDEADKEAEAFMQAFVQSIVDSVNQVLDSLLATETQEEFDQILMQASQMAGSIAGQDDDNEAVNAEWNTTTTVEWDSDTKSGLDQATEHETQAKLGENAHDENAWETE